MATALVENITANLATTLAGVTVANGYEITVPEVRRPVRRGLAAAAQHYGCDLVRDLPALRFAEAAAMVTEEYTQSWWVDVVVRLSDEATTPWDQAAAAAEAAIHKGLLVDPTRGGLAIDTAVEPAMERVNAGDGTVEGISIPVTVRYRHLHGDPYTQA